MNEVTENTMVVDPTLVPVVPGEGEATHEEGKVFVAEDAADHSTHAA